MTTCTSSSLGPHFPLSPVQRQSPTLTSPNGLTHSNTLKTDSPAAPEPSSPLIFPILSNSTFLFVLFLWSFLSFFLYHLFSLCIGSGSTLSLLGVHKSFRAGHLFKLNKKHWIKLWTAFISILVLRPSLELMYGLLDVFRAHLWHPHTSF